MTLEELTQLAAAQQMIVTRHDREITSISTTLVNTNATLANANDTLDRIAAQQEAAESRQAVMEQQAALNQEAIATLTASIQELRNVVADYIQGRSQS